MHVLRPRRGVLRCALLAAAVVALVPAAGASAAPDPRANDLGIQVVRFAKGTSPAAMRAAVEAAGGQVVTDLSRIGALTVVPSDAATFKTKLKAQRSVKGAWLDRVTAAQQTVQPGFTPDPLHDATSFWGETNPEGILQWDDNRNGVREAWRTTAGSPDVKVAVIDSGIQPSHKELRDNVVAVDNTIPCNRLNAIFGPGNRFYGNIRDCAIGDTDGHGTWVASRIAGAVNGLGSNGIAANVKVLGFKALATDFGGLTSWIADAMLRACDADADVINMSLGGYDDPADKEYAKENAEDYFLWQDAVDYCRAKGTAIVASAGNDHVRVQRRTVTLTGLSGTRTFEGAGVVDSGDEGINSAPGEEKLQKYVNDYRGMLETPAGNRGVVMVSATSNTIPDPAGNVVDAFKPPASAVGTKDNLSYYSSYGSRVDVAAPGGARKHMVPNFDTKPGTDILYGGWGELAGIDKSAEICQSSLGAPSTFACFEEEGAGFAWLQGTSMSAPEATGVAALVLSARPELRESPDALATALTSTARAADNHTGASSPSKAPGWDEKVPCTVGFCHVDWSRPIDDASAYGAGIVDAAAAIRR